MIKIDFDKYELSYLVKKAVKEVLADEGISHPKHQPDMGGIELAMEETGYAKATIYDLVHKRKLPFHKKGKKLFFSRKEIQEWISSGRVKTDEEIKDSAMDNIR